jgi:hypothetical protein
MVSVFVKQKTVEDKGRRRMTGALNRQLTITGGATNQPQTKQ